MVLFTALFVVIVISLLEYINPERTSLVFIVAAGSSALIGSVIGNKLFPVKE